MDNITAPSQNSKQSSHLKLKPAQLMVLIVIAILIITVIIFLIAGLSKPKPAALDIIPSTPEATAPKTTEEIPTHPQPQSVPVKITSYIGTVKSIDGASIQLEVSNEKNPGIQGAQTIKVNVTKQTALIQRIRPAVIPAGVDPASVFKQKPITVKDLQIGDEIIASAGGEDLSGKTEFTAASIMKIIITS